MQCVKTANERSTRAMHVIGVSVDGHIQHHQRYAVTKNGNVTKIQRFVAQRVHINPNREVI